MSESTEHSNSMTTHVEDKTIGRVLERLQHLRDKRWKDVLESDRPENLRIANRNRFNEIQSSCIEWTNVTSHFNFLSIDVFLSIGVECCLQSMAWNFVEFCT